MGQLGLMMGKVHRYIGNADMGHSGGGMPTPSAHVPTLPANSQAFSRCSTAICLLTGEAGVKGESRCPSSRWGTGMLNWVGASWVGTRRERTMADTSAHAVPNHDTDCLASADSLQQFRISTCSLQSIDLAKTKMGLHSENVSSG